MIFIKKLKEFIKISYFESICLYLSLSLCVSVCVCLCIDMYQEEPRIPRTGANKAGLDYEWMVQEYLTLGQGYVEAIVQAMQVSKEKSTVYREELWLRLQGGVHLKCLKNSQGGWGWYLVKMQPIVLRLANESDPSIVGAFLGLVQHLLCWD